MVEQRIWWADADGLGIWVVVTDVRLIVANWGISGQWQGAGLGDSTFFKKVLHL